MKVALIDADLTAWPNLHLMRRATYYRSRGDEVIFPYSGGERVDHAVISCVFRKSQENVRAWLSFLPPGVSVEVGGTGWSLDPGPADVEACRPDYDLYGLTYGIGFASRGCPRGCNFCVVPQISGRKVKQVATLGELANPKSRFIKLLDDNFWAPGAPWREILTEAREDRYELCFAQGLDVRFADNERAELLSQVKFWDQKRHKHRINVAFDHIESEKALRKGLFSLLGYLKPDQINCFVLTGFNTLPEEDEYRVAVLDEYGVEPFIMVYEPVAGEVPAFYADLGWTLPEYESHFRRCRRYQRFCNRKAIRKSVKDFRLYER